jgi:protein-tyrosine phosphatase
MLDLVTPEIAQLNKAADAIQSANQHGPVLVCCALGVSRSAAAVVAWLVAHHRMELDEALHKVSAARPQVVMHDSVVARLRQLASIYRT